MSFPVELIKKGGYEEKRKLLMTLAAEDELLRLKSGDNQNKLTILVIHLPKKH